jgi:beta-galactosidase
MRIKIILILLLFCVLLSEAGAKSTTPQKSPRIEKIINSHWTFNYFPAESRDVGCEAPGYDDSKWPVISIPHTWSTYETTGEIHPFIKSASENDNPYWWTGWGWYRKHFIVNTDITDKKVFIEFEGVQKYCRVWINGKYLGDHKGGYGSFDFDITDHLIKGKDNVLVVAVNNRQKDEFNIPPMAAGNFNVYGGIYRDVTLVIKNKLFIPMQGSATHEGGTFVTTPVVSEKAGTVRVQTWVKNDYSQPKTCSLSTFIIDASAKVLQVLTTKYTIGPKQVYKFDQVSKPVKTPHLWSPDNPYLYRVWSEVTDGSRVADSYSSPLGFRWFRWDYKENFLHVNGKKVIIHGGNRHQEYPWLGDAIPKWITEMDFRDIAVNLNYNFMRTAHYPNDKYVYDLTDRYGIMIDEESPSIKNQSFSPEVQEMQMKEMIRRDRNHPSIMFWSMGNETNHAVDSKIAFTEDTTRILTARRVTEGSAGIYVKHTDENLALENLLRCTIRGWYNKDVRDLEPEDQQYCGTEEHQQNMLKASGRFGTGNLCTWLYEDHGADREYLNSPLLHVNPKGYVDVYRVPKYAYYFWQATYHDQPMVYIQPHYWRSQYLGQKHDITVNSNCTKVELFVNGVSIGSLVPDQGNFHSVTFKDILVEKGTLSAVGTREGKTVTSKVEMADVPAKIVLSGSSNKITADPASVVIISADIVDAQGNHVYGANNPVRWTVTGPATLVGPSFYETDINKNQEKEGVWYIDMPVSNVIRSTGKPGKIRVTLSASGLASGSFEIEAELLKPDGSVISEPVPDERGRLQVTRPVFSVARLDEVPQDIKKTFNDITLSAADLKGYAAAIKDLIVRNNQSADTTTIEFRTLVTLLSSHLVNTGGRLIADDFNFNVEHYNTCRLISGYIVATKLPPLFKETLKQYYADILITGGKEKNAGDEMNWLNWIPSGGTVIVSQDGNTPAWPKGTYITGKSELYDLIITIYPVFEKYNAEAKERALTFIKKMNPYIIEKEVITGGQKKIVFAAIKGRPVLIPLIKFISE